MNSISNKSFNCNYGQQKRRLENPTEENSIKKRRTESEEGKATEAHLLWGQTDILRLISESLSSKEDLLSYELIASRFKYATDTKWQQIRAEERLDFDFSFCTTERDHYLVGKALSSYILDHSKRQPEIAQTTYNRYENLMKSFPIFGAYIYKDLTSITPIKSRYKDLFETNVMREVLEKGGGGDYLLRGLYYFLCFSEIETDSDPISIRSSKKNQQIINCIQTAIQKKASCISYLVLEKLINKNHIEWRKKTLASTIVRQWFVHLATLAASVGDYRGLDQLIWINTDMIVNLPYPSVLYYHGLREADLDKKDKLFNLAIIGYQKWVPAKVFFEAACNKMKLYHEQKDPEKAQIILIESLFDKALAGYGEKGPAKLYYNAATTKDNLKKWEEAESLYDKALASYGEKGPASLYHNAAIMKDNLKKWEEAEPLYDKALAGYGEKGPTNLYHNAAILKGKLKKWEEAEPLYDKALAGYGEKGPTNFYHSAAITKGNRGKWKEAELLFNKVLTAYGEKGPAYIYPNLAIMKGKLGKWEEAERLFAKALASYGEKGPASLYHNAAIMKDNLKKWEEAEPLYDKALAGYGEKGPTNLYHNAAILKGKLKKWEEAEPLYDKALAGYGEKGPTNFYHSAAITKGNRGKWKEAELLFNKVLTAYGEKGPAYIYPNLAIMKGKLGKWEEAERLFAKAFDAYGEKRPANLYYHAALTKSKLGCWSAAHSLMDEFFVVQGDRPIAENIESFYIEIKSKVFPK